MRYKVLKIDAMNIEQTERDLNKVSASWSLVQLIPGSDILPGIGIDGRPKIKPVLVAVFECIVDEFENKE